MVQSISETSAFQWPTVGHWNADVSRHLYPATTCSTCIHGIVPRTKMIARAITLQQQSSCLYLRSTSISQGHLRTGMKTHLFNLCFKSTRIVLTYLFTAERSGPENWMSREQGVKKYGGAGAGAERWAGSTEKGMSGERKFPPLPLRSHALQLDKVEWPTSTPFDGMGPIIIIICLLLHMSIRTRLQYEIDLVENSDGQ